MKAVMLKNIFVPSALIFAVVLGVGACKCGNKSSGDATVINLTYPKGEPLAEVGGKTMTLEEVGEDFIFRQGTFAGAAHLNTDSKKKEFVENQVMQEAMLQEAIALDYFNNPEVKRNVKKIVIQQLMRDKLDAVQAEYVATPEEMLEHYNKNQNLYKRDEAIKVSFIAIPMGDKLDKSLKLAQNMWNEANTQGQETTRKTFSKIALNQAKNGLNGVSGKIESNETDYLESAAFNAKFGPGTFDKIKALSKTGDIAPLMSDAQNYYVMMKSGYRKELNETMEEASDKIKKRLAFENRGKAYETYLTTLRGKYKIKIHEDKIAELGKNAMNAVKQKENVKENVAANN